MEFPSPELTQQLSTLGLAGAADLRRCAGRVRRLARGLSATESVWLDALVLSGKLSQYQARALESDRGHELIVGRKFVIHQALHLDPLLSTFIARAPGRRERFLISRMPCPVGEGEAAALRLLKTIKNCAALRNQFSHLPFDAALEQGEISLVAPFTEGDSLGRLLVRRGRFPEQVVRAIAQELLRILQAAESLALHGDLRPANVWLTRRGEIQLLNWGLLDAVAPEINIHSQLPLDAYDGLAPERTETLKRATTASDIYALGCLLWQLLTGRPPFAVADSLAKISAHRSRAVPDVRTLAPDVSDSLAQLIRSLTAREPHRRPQNYTDIRQSLGAISPWNRNRLYRFRQQFESAAPRQVSEQSPKSTLPRLAGVAVLSIGLCVVAWNRDRLGGPTLERLSAAVRSSGKPHHHDLLQIPDPSGEIPRKSAGISSPVSEETPFAVSKLTDSIPPADLTVKTAIQAMAPEFPPPASATAPSIPLQPLPSPTLDGVLVLDDPRAYAAEEVITGATLLLKGTPAQPALIRIQDVPLILEAEHVRLEHVQILIDRQSPLSPGVSPLQLRANAFSMNQCWLVDERSGEVSPLVFWSRREESTENGARLLIQESVIRTTATLFDLQIPFTAGQFEHVFVQGAGTILDAKRGAGSGLRAPFIFKACSLQQCGPVLRFPEQEILNGSGQVSLQGSDSAIGLQRGAPLVRIHSPDASSDLSSHLEVNARGLVVEVGSMLVGAPQAGLSSDVELPSDDLRVDGLLLGDFHFEPDSLTRGTLPRVQIDALPVRLSNLPPGAEISRLPQARTDVARDSGG